MARKRFFRGALQNLAFYNAPFIRYVRLNAGDAPPLKNEAISGRGNAVTLTELLGKVAVIGKSSCAPDFAAGKMGALQQLTCF